MGENAIKHWLDVYRENTKYIQRIPAAEFENLVTELGIEQIESVVVREKRKRKRIEEQKSIWMETDDDDSDGYSSMDAKSLPTAERKQRPTAEPKYR